VTHHCGACGSSADLQNKYTSRSSQLCVANMIHVACLLVLAYKLSNTHIDYHPPTSVLQEMQKWREQQERKQAKTEQVLCGDTTGCAALRKGAPPAQTKKLGDMAKALITASETLQKLEAEMAEYGAAGQIKKERALQRHPKTNKRTATEKEMGKLQHERLAYDQRYDQLQQEPAPPSYHVHSQVTPHILGMLGAPAPGMLVPTPRPFQHMQRHRQGTHHGFIHIVNVMHAVNPSSSPSPSIGPTAYPTLPTQSPTHPPSFSPTWLQMHRHRKHTQRPTLAITSRPTRAVTMKPTQQPTPGATMQRHRQGARYAGPSPAPTTKPAKPHKPESSLSFTKAVPNVVAESSSPGLCTQKIRLYCGIASHGAHCRACVNENWEELAFSCSSNGFGGGSQAGASVASACV
jgi:hypothetical protein